MSFLGELWDNTAGGLLWKPLKKATGLNDAQLALAAAGVVTGGAALAGAGAAGAGAAGAGAAGAGTAGAVIGGSGAPISAAAGAAMESSLAAAGYGGASTGFMPSMAQAGEYAKLGGNVLGAASAAKGLLSSPQQPVAQAQPRPLQLDAGLLSTNSQGIEDEAQRRRQLINQYAQNAMGGGYARPT
jgi:hypothetical protein